MAGTSVIRVSILGQMPGGEQWSVNPTFFCLDEPADITTAEANTMAIAIDGITVPTGLRALMSSGTTVSGARVEARDRDGTLRALGEHTRTSPVAGNGVSPHPYQTTAVCSLRSGFPGGRGRGRLYWPATGVGNMTAQLRLAGTEHSGALTGFQTYLKAIQDAIAVSAGPVELAVWSRAGSAFHTVTELRVGDVLDTQRRRRDTLTESYLAASYPA